MPAEEGAALMPWRVELVIVARGVLDERVEEGREQILLVLGGGAEDFLLPRPSFVYGAMFFRSNCFV